jgi:hypothetical protein
VCVCVCVILLLGYIFISFGVVFVNYVLKFPNLCVMVLLKIGEVCLEENSVHVFVRAQRFFYTTLLNHAFVIVIATEYKLSFCYDSRQPMCSRKFRLKLLF